MDINGIGTTLNRAIRILESDEGQLQEAGFVIGAKGLEKPHSKISILPNREYYIGHSTSPDHVIVTSVTPDRVTYRSYPYKKDNVMQTWIFADMATRGTRQALKQRGKYFDAATRKSYEDLLAGGKGRPIKISDYERIRVVARAKDPNAGDLWRDAEQYGNVGGIDGPDGMQYEIEMDRRTLVKLKKDRKFVVVKVEDM